MSDQNAPPKSSRRIPLLVWIVLAALVAWFVLMMTQRDGTHRTPTGGTMPMAEEGAAVMPPTPADGTTPTTPGSMRDGNAAPR